MLARWKKFGSCCLILFMIAQGKEYFMNKLRLYTYSLAKCNEYLRIHFWFVQKYVMSKWFRKPLRNHIRNTSIRFLQIHSLSISISKLLISTVSETPIYTNLRVSESNVTRVFWGFASISRFWNHLHTTDSCKNQNQCINIHSSVNALSLSFWWST